jgi:hypothetical protein
MVVGILAVAAFGAGFAVGAAQGSISAPAWTYGGVIGFLITIFIVLILFRMITFALFGHHRRAWGHHGYWRGDFGPGQFGPGQFGPGQFGPGQFTHFGRGPRGWQHGEDWRQVGQAWFDDFHGRSHGSQTPAGGDAPTTDQSK